MSAIAAAFAAARARDEAALVPYVTAGFPTLERSLELIAEAARGGADVVEVGVPFSDPVADGPTIQHASSVALENGTTLRAILAALSQRDFELPLVLMSYLNPLLALGDDLFDRLRAAGIAGLIVPDLPLEEAGAWSERAAAAGIDLVLLAAPTSPPERLQAIARASRGFVYAVAVTGVTGARSEIDERLTPMLATLREATELPVAAGFGISTPEQVARLAAGADGLVVGSRLIDAIRNEEDFESLVRELKQATRRAPCSSS